MAKINKIYRNWVEYEIWWVEPNVIAVTQSEYNALTTEEKNDGKLRIIKDAPAVDLWNIITLKQGSPQSIEYIWVWTTAQYNALSSKDNNTVYITL